MPKHEEYEELCALALIGQLPAEEYAELSEHMRSCESCRRAAQDFQDVVNHLPIADPNVDIREVVQLQEGSRAERFLATAKAEGLSLSKDASRSLKPSRPARISLFEVLTASRLTINPALASLVVLCLIGAFWLGVRRLQLGASSWPQHVITVSRPPVPALGDAGLAKQLAEADDQVAQLEQELAVVTERLAAARRSNETADARLRQQADLATKVRTQADLIALLQQQANLTSQLRQKTTQQEAIIAQLTAEGENARNERDRVNTTLAQRETRLHNLELELKNLESSFEREHELNGVASDVRELMGARSLHIVDVYDSDNRERLNAVFGRVFYTEGKSLIFYAFDLDKAHGVRKVSFNAWGVRDGDRKEPRRLGVFYIDNATQKRWVMKVNDPAKLAAIDTVFVTVETRQDADAPRGQRILQAFLGSMPNHP